MFLHGLSAACSLEGGYGEGDPEVTGTLGQVCPGTAVSPRLIGVHSSQFCDPGQQAGQGWQEPPRGGLGAQKVWHWGPPGSGPAERTLECPPHGAPLPTSAVRPSHGPLLQDGGGHCLSCPREASCVSHVLQELFLALGQPSLGGLLLGGVLFTGLVTVQADTFSPWDQGEPRLISDKHM